MTKFHKISFQGPLHSIKQSYSIRIVLTRKASCVNAVLTRKVSCVNARDIPPAAQQVLTVLLCLWQVPTLDHQLEGRYPPPPTVG